MHEPNLVYVKPSFVYNSVPIGQNPIIFFESQGDEVSNLHVKFGFDIHLCLEFTV